MGREVKLSRVESVLGEVSYPIGRSEAAEAFDDVTLRFSDGQANLGELIADTETESFASMNELGSELNNVLPREAVGEPYQSEGEG